MIWQALAAGICLAQRVRMAAVRMAGHLQVTCLSCLPATEPGGRMKAASEWDVASCLIFSAETANCGFWGFGGLGFWDFGIFGVLGSFLEGQADFAFGCTVSQHGLPCQAKQILSTCLRCAA